MDHLLAGCRAARPRLQVNVKAVLLPITKVWLVIGRIFGFDTNTITLVFVI